MASPDFIIDLQGDVEVEVQGRTFLVKASKLAALSPTFSRIFDEVEGEMISIPDLEFEVFRRMAQLAHGYFIPQADISLDLLVKLSHALRDYQISATSALYNTLNFSLVYRSLYSAQLPAENLVKLLQVAKALHFNKLRQLLLDVLDGYSRDFDTSLAYLDPDNCALLLRKTHLP